jgi:predicted amidohydrolase
MNATVAAAQISPDLGAKRDNLARIKRALEESVSQGARLTVLPECALTGYVYDSRAEALEQAEPVPGRPAICSQV